MKLHFFYVDGGFHPVVGRVLHWRQDAVGGGDAHRYKRYICGVLGAVAQTIEDCDYLLSCFDRVEGGDELMEVGGNDVVLSISAKGVQVDIEINDEWVGQAEGFFLIQEWRLAILAWKAFLKLPKSLDSDIEVQLK